MALNGRQLRGGGGGGCPGKHEACSSLAAGHSARCGKAAATWPSPMGAAPPVPASPEHRPTGELYSLAHTTGTGPLGQRRKPRAREVGVVARWRHSTSHAGPRLEPGLPTCSAARKAAQTDDPTAPRSRHPDPCLGPCRVIFRWWRELLVLPFRWAKISIYPAREQSPQANL